MTEHAPRYLSRRLEEQAAISRTLADNPQARLSPQMRGGITQSRNHRRKAGYPDDPDSFAATLIRLREDRGLSQARLAMLSGYNNGYISRLESDDRAPTRDAVLKFSEAMGLDAQQRDELLAAAGFLPLDPAHLLSREVALSRVYALLCDPAIAPALKTSIRASLASLADMAAGHGEAVSHD